MDDLLNQMSGAIERKEHHKIEAVLVECAGETLYERYFDRTDGDTRIDPRSAGKSITAMALGVAIDEGAIKHVDVRLFSYFESADPEMNSIR
jgi:hypothetical protein